MIKYLVDKGADVNASDSKGFTPLMSTVMNRYKFESIFLLSRGANVDVLDPDGCNLSHRAAFNNDVEMLKLLGGVSRE